MTSPRARLMGGVARVSLAARAKDRWASRSALPAQALVAVLATLGYLEILPCPFAALLSLPCPGCGLSRAAHDLLAGDVRAALALHPLSPLVVPSVAAGLLWVLCAPSDSSTLHSAARSGLACKVAALWSVTLLGLLIGVWIARFFGALGGPVPVF